MLAGSFLAAIFEELPKLQKEPSKGDLSASSAPPRWSLILFNICPS